MVVAQEEVKSSGSFVHIQIRMPFRSSGIILIGYDDHHHPHSATDYADDDADEVEVADSWDTCALIFCCCCCSCVIIRGEMCQSPGLLS